MGEDRTTCVEKNYNKGTNGDVVPCRHRHSSVISSCSEDAESESTSAGYPPSPDEEREEELEYGPGIVNKLRTRFLSISLKQTRGSNMRRSCSMENLLDQDRPSSGASEERNCAVLRKPVWGNLKRAKSMDTLLMEMAPEPPVVQKPKIIRRQEGGMTRLICDEELPKPDTVKTYKRMFEPAESRRGSYGRRPPVLRASAKSTAAAKTNGVTSSTPSAKVTAPKGKYNSAKQALPVKAQIDNNNTEVITNGINGKKPVMNGEHQVKTNGCHVVKATPVKIHNNVANNIINNVRNNNINNKDVEKNFNSINRLLSSTKKEVHFSPKPDVICNGKQQQQHNDVAKIKTCDEKPLVKTLNGVETTLNCKPKVPPNRPNLRSPRPLMKIDELKQNGKVGSPKLLLKPTVVNGFKKPPSDPAEIDSNKRVKSPELNGRFEPTVEPRILNHHNDSKPEKKHQAIITEVKEVVVVKEKAIEVENKLPSDSPQLPQEKAEVKPPPQEPPVKPSSPVVESPPKVDAPKSSPEPPPTLKKIEKTVSEPPPKPKDTPDGVIKKFEKPSPEKKQQLHNGVHEGPAVKPVKKAPSTGSTSMVFDFRGKDVVSHVAVMPAPFGCKGASPPKKRLVDGKEGAVNGTLTDDEDEEYVDYSVPPPSGVVFEGENVKVGRGSILATRNKELKIKFDDDVDSNTFVYPSESSLLEDPERSLSPPLNGDSETIPNGHPPKLKANTVIGSSSAGGLSTYTPSVLRTMENFEPGMFRPSPPVEEERNKRPAEDGEEENTDVRSPDLLKPADPELITAWSVSAGTSDLLF